MSVAKSLLPSGPDGVPKASNGAVRDLPANIATGGDEENKTSQAHELTAAVRREQSLLKTVIAMAIDRYGFDPKAPRSKTTREIADALSRVGLSLDEATILNQLRRGAELLPVSD